MGKLRFMQLEIPCLLLSVAACCFRTYAIREASYGLGVLPMFPIDCESVPPVQVVG